MNCSSLENSDIKIYTDFYYSGHPMGGLTNLFGIINLAWKDKIGHTDNEMSEATQSIFPFEVHPNYSEVTLFGSSSYDLNLVEINIFFPGNEFDKLRDKIEARAIISRKEYILFQNPEWSDHTELKCNLL